MKNKLSIWFNSRKKELKLSDLIVTLIIMAVITRLISPCISTIVKTSKYEKVIATEPSSLSYKYGEELFVPEKNVEIYVNPENPKDYVTCDAVKGDWGLTIIYVLTMTMMISYLLFYESSAKDETSTDDQNSEIIHSA